MNLAEFKKIFEKEILLNYMIKIKCSQFQVVVFK
jgi:hypothetical protein